MQFIRPAVQTYGIGQARVDGGGPAGGRHQGQTVLPAELAHRDPPAADVRAGRPGTDIDIAARDILRMRERINDILVLHTGQPVKRIEEETERDYIMTAEQGKEYGILDEVIRKRA